MESILSYEEIAQMREFGKVARSFLWKIKKILRAGLTTKDIEIFFDRYLDKYPHLKSAFRGYNSYPASICVSVNEEIIHGIPSAKKTIANGCVLSIDLGLEGKGLFVDCAYSYIVGRVSELTKKLVKIGLRSLKEGIKRARVGSTVGDIGFAIQRYVEANGFSIIKTFVGHGIGRALHCEPEVPNFGTKGQGQVLKEGMVLAIEPMISSGTGEVDILDDGWTAKTKDNSLSCHFEHTVAITKKGPWILTK